MATAQQTEINAEYAERFAALWAGADTSNANDAEASGKWREVRRMAKAVNLRVIDVMCRSEVMRALDAQLSVERQVAPELAEAREQAAKYLKETRAAVAEVTRLAELVKRQEDIISELRGQAMARPVMQAACAAGGGPAREFVGGLFAFVGLAALLFLGAWAIETAVFGG
jgi:hypothetical protein